MWRFGWATPRKLDSICLLAGALLPLAFAPFKLFPLGVLMPAILFSLWLGCSPQRAAWRGFLFGCGMFGIGTSWIYVSLHTYGNMPVPLAGLAVVLFTAILAAFPALVGNLQGRYRHSNSNVQLLLVIPALWVLAEWLRGWFLTGFPWLHLGYSQVPSALSGVAPWLGVYGVSLAVAMSAALVVRGLCDRRQLWRRYVPGLALLWAVGWFAGTINWTQPVGDPIRVTLVQANIPLAAKWAPEQRQSILEAYFQLSTRASDPDLIIWPEAAMPAYLDEIDSQYLAHLRRYARDTNSDFLIGVVERDQGRYYNSVISLGSSPGIYRKRHLVPFGEFLPFKTVSGWLLNYLNIPMSDFSAGEDKQKPIRAAGQAIGLSICYEDAYGEEIIRALPEATFLVNVSEDAWFGNSLAPYQRLQMSRMRALETSRVMLRVANTGLSAVIDSRGEVVVRTPQFQPYVLTREIQPLQGSTPYTKFGNWVVIMLTCLLAGLGWAEQNRLGSRIFPWKSSRRKDV